MYSLKTIALKSLLFSILFFSIPSFIYSQSSITKDSVNLSNQKTAALLEMVMKSLPADKKAIFEETLQALTSVKPSVSTIDLTGKTVSFIPLAHASSAGFYENVRDLVLEYKTKGYKIYYEQVRSEKRSIADSTTKDTTRLKFRKMIGVEPTRESYSILKKLVPALVVQPPYKDLGVSDSDINADVTTRQMVDKYEELYGEIRLTACDFETQLGTIIYPCEKLVNDNKVVIIDFRNRYVADLIKNAKDNKILVLYGADHIKGIAELIRQ